MEEKCQPAYCNGLPIDISEQDVEDCPSLSGILTKLSDQISANGASKEKAKIITDLMSDIRNKRRVFREHQLILDAVSDIATVHQDLSSNVPPSVAHKVQRIMTLEKLKNLSCGSATAGSANPLGFLDSVISVNVELDCEESLQLLTAVEQRVLKTCKDAIEVMEYNKGHPVEDRNEAKLKLISELDTKIKRSRALLAKEYSILEEMCRMKEGCTGDVLKTCDGLIAEHKVAELKASLTEHENLTKLYSNENAIQAINKIATSLQEQLATCKEQLQKLEADEALYADLEVNEKYKKILKEYEEIQKEISHKKWLLGIM